MKFLSASWTFGKWLAGCLRDILLVSVWLLLLGLLLVQIGVVTSHQLPMPAWMLRKIETRLNTAGLRVKIDHATIDPAGRVLIHNLQLIPPIFDAALAKIDTLYLRLSPIALMAGEVEPRDVHIDGLNLQLPAILSPTGKTESVISNVRLAFKPNRDIFTIDELSGQVANLTISVRGSVTIPDEFKPNSQKKADLPALVATAIRKYTDLARQITERSYELAALDRPHLSIDLTSQEDKTSAKLTLTCRNMDIDLTRLRSGAGRLLMTDLRLSTDLSLTPKLPEVIILDASCLEAKTTTDYKLQDVNGNLTVKFTNEPAAFTATSLFLSAKTAVAKDILFQNPLVRLNRDQSPTVKIDFISDAIGTPWHIQAEIETNPGLGQIEVEGALTPLIVKQIAEKIGIEPDLLLKLKKPAPLRLAVDLSAGWKFDKARGRISFGPVVGYTVPFTSGDADVYFDGTELSFTNIAATQGENAATGSYWMNVKNKDFRFLLDGHLRPMGIEGFFEDWWSNFWGHFDFSPAAPEAHVDVAGRWGRPYTTTVFVTADIARPSISNVAFDRVRATMFIRPDFYDATEFVAERGGRSARGTFTRVVDLYREKDSLRYINFAVTSNLDLVETAKIFGTEGTETVEPFTFAAPPTLHLSGRVDGPASGRGSHRLVQIDLKSTGAFSLYNFPLTDLTFRGAIRDADIDLPEIQVSFAEGQASGSAYISGSAPNRQLRFDCKLNGALLGEAISTLEHYAAKERGEASPVQSKFQQQIAQGRLNLQLAAVGMYSDPLSFYGHGSMELSGAQLAQINLLGALSLLLSKTPLFKFTALQLNEAHSSFILEREKLVLPDLRITGSSATIETKGTYQLDKKFMEFGAKVYPFGQGKTFLANAVGFVLVPISNALELKLSGPLDQPNWRLAYGPTNFIYNITGTKPSELPLEPSQPGTPNRFLVPHLKR